MGPHTKQVGAEFFGGGDDTRAADFDLYKTRYLTSGCLSGARNKDVPHTGNLPSGHWACTASGRLYFRYTSLKMLSIC